MPDIGPDQFETGEVVVRLADEADQPAIRALFEEGLTEGQVPINDTGADIDNLIEGYFNDSGSSAFWVASWRGEVVAMIGVQRVEPNCAEMRRLRVKSGYRRRGLGSMMLSHALNFCRENGYLKVVLDVRIEREPAIRMFEKSGFILSRTREVEGRKMLDFYLDLYREPPHA
jgi:putative acetyltransferase